MMNADLALARRFVAAYKPAGTLLCCAVTGAHIYGFPSADSDLDIKGIHLVPTRALLGLRRSPRGDAHDITEDFEGVECDFTTNEAGEALTILLSGNGNMLERILSPLQVVDHPHLEELQTITRKALSQRFAKHYVGFFHGCRRELLRSSTLKSLLYAYRVGLTGTHLLTSGQLETDVTVLAPQYDFEAVAALVSAKRQGREHGVLGPDIVERHTSALDRLQLMLLAAEESSPLPPTAQNADELNDWLVDRRLDNVG